MQLFYQPAIPEGVFHLSEEESRHAIKVLRLTDGATIDLCDGKGKFYKAIITQAHHKKCQFEISATTAIPAAATYRHIAIAPTKNIDRTEWFVEKAVEFGIDRISPIICDHSERRVVKTERLIKKAVSAMKQSLKAWCPQVDEAMTFKAFLKETAAEHRFIAYVDSSNTAYLKDLLQPSGSHIVMIGPEGDFSENEVNMALEAGFQKVSLGPSRLRTETAGIAAIHLLNL